LNNYDDNWFLTLSSALSEESAIDLLD